VDNLGTRKHLTIVFEKLILKVRGCGIKFLKDTRFNKGGLMDIPG